MFCILFCNIRLSATQLPLVSPLKHLYSPSIFLYFSIFVAIFRNINLSSILKKSHALSLFNYLISNLYYSNTLSVSGKYVVFLFFQQLFQPKVYFFFAINLRIFFNTFFSWCHCINFLLLSQTFFLFICRHTFLSFFETVSV